MAVTRMKKVTLIAQSKWQEELLKVLQDLQQVQVRDVFVQNVSNEWVHTYFDGVSPKDISQDLLDYQQKIQKINEAIDFVNHYGSIKVKNQLLKRQNLSLYDLDQLHKEPKDTRAPGFSLRPGRTRHSQVLFPRSMSSSTSTAPPPGSRWPISRAGSTRESLSTRQSPGRSRVGRS